MSKRLLFLPLAFALACGSAFAQGPTITSAISPKAGDKVFTFVADPNGIEPGASGANVTWDFSSLQADSANTKVESEVKASSGTPYASQFPGANLVTSSVSGQSLMYFSTDNDRNESFGAVVQNSGQTVVQKFTNTMINYSFPMSYNYAHNDDFTATYTANGMQIDGRGWIKVTADGYGTLKLKGKTFNNVLRLVSEAWRVDSTIMMGQELFRMETYNKAYAYVTPSQKENLLTISFVEIDVLGNKQSSKSVTFNENGTSTSAIDELSGSAAEVSVYPNPANGQAWLQFDMNNARQGSIRVLDLSGKVMMTQSAYFNAGRNTQLINTESLPKGMYMVQIQAEGSSAVSARLVVN